MGPWPGKVWKKGDLDICCFSGSGAQLCSVLHLRWDSYLPYPRKSFFHFELKLVWVGFLSSQPDEPGLWHVSVWLALGVSMWQHSSLWSSILSFWTCTNVHLPFRTVTPAASKSLWVQAVLPLWQLLTRSWTTWRYYTVPRSTTKGRLSWKY